MKLSSRFSKAVHILSLLVPAKDAHCTSEWIARAMEALLSIITMHELLSKRTAYINMKK